MDGPPEVLAEVRKSKAPLVDIKWCSDGTFFLVASEDGRVYIHNAQDCSLKTICAKAQAPLTSIDLSLDATHVQAATRANQLKFYSVVDGTFVGSPAAVRDEKWTSITVPIGWNVQGCWDAARTDNIMEQAKHGCPQTTNRDSAYVTSVHRAPNHQYLAKGCIDGTVAVYNYPTHAPGMRMLRVPGHGSSIAKVRFTSDGKYLVALGQFNRTITQYEIQI